jgi:hypothetical protein
MPCPKAIPMLSNVLCVALSKDDTCTIRVLSAPSTILPCQATAFDECPLQCYNLSLL